MTQTNIKPLLQERANCLKMIRGFFDKNKVMEVDTRLLDTFSVTDPYMTALSLEVRKQKLFLQTSPEFAMKRLLSQGSDDIYQLGKAFRAEEKGQYHDIEFTMLEWYRVGFSLKELMSEVYQLIVMILGEKEKETLSYQQVFIEILKIDPFSISTKELEVLVRQEIGDIPNDLLRDNYLTLLFSEVIEPALSVDKITFIYNYPESQASLARVKIENGNLVAERFEVYSGGVELANGFYELTDPQEQLKRFEQDNKIRRKLKYNQIDIDHRLIDALKIGIPECSGVALGFDRLLMLKLELDSISQVLPLGDNLQN
jgi:elongation factor P--(R)-beta-lysine ligase